MRLTRPGPLGSALRLLRDEFDRPALMYSGWMILLVILSGALSAATPLALKHLVDAVASSTQHAPPPEQAAVLVTGLTYLLALTGTRLASDMRPLLASRVEQRVLAGLRRRFFAHVLRLPMAWLSQHRTGEVLHSADLAVAGCQLLISHMTGSLAPVLVELAIMGYILANLEQPALLALFALSSALYLVVFTLGTLRLRPAVRELSSASTEVQARLNDGVAHVETIRCFNATHQTEVAMADALVRLSSRWIDFNRLTVQAAIAASIVFALTLAACLVMSSAAVGRHEMSVGGFVLASVYMLQMVRPLEVLGSASKDFSRALGFLQPLMDILSRPAESEGPTKEQDPATTAKRQGAPSVRFQNLHFSYDERHPVLRGLDLDIPAGRTTAIVGRSGSGKSSLARLLLRLYTPQSGCIFIDGRPLHALATAELRCLVGYVPQEAGLLHGTVASNIALGVPGASDEAIARATQDAQLGPLLKALPHGLGTTVGEHGHTLSGGERQRLAIARALLREPALYILDEPTSMLDSKTEADVMATIATVTAGRTTVLIAHRLSTVMHADEIVVLDQGQVHERGRHDDLIARGGIYAHLWHQQSGSCS
jgi:ATP-binding cassette subfamily B protein